MFGRKDKWEHVCPEVTVRWVYPSLSIVEALQLIGANVIQIHEARELLGLNKILKTTEENK